MSTTTSLPAFREFEGFGLVRLAMGWDENSSSEPLPVCLLRKAEEIELITPELSLGMQL